MTANQTPESLRRIVEHAIKQPEDFVQDQDAATGKPYETVAKWKSHAVLAALFGACEVREERRIVIDDEQVTGLWLAAAWAGDCDVLAATYSSGRVERRFVIETTPEPVSSTGEEEGR